ncbi:nucleoside-diphosphate kinase [Weissella minor]|uniref:nucleoside-diphosphate kinase n=1 Tax=Weissella minor TaxID=1620 RepID=UPI001BAEFE62|nr:nucleoside-diphosphate kinase [Weissella minor]MBS0949401.1 nucleoside-diphosphate kinase [Weissella minor]
MTQERTLILIKPDGVALGHIGEVITRIERKGYQIQDLKVTHATDELLAQHYADKVDQPFYPKMSRYMQEGPIVAMVVSGVNVVPGFRRLAGATSPGEADFGTIRGDFGREWEDGVLRNVVHSSDSEEAAEREIGIWFGK